MYFIKMKTAILQMPLPQSLLKTLLDASPTVATILHPTENRYISSDAQSAMGAAPPDTAIARSAVPEAIALHLDCSFTTFSFARSILVKIVNKND